MFGIRSLRCTSGITLFFFLWMSLYPALAAALLPVPGVPAAAAGERGEERGKNALDELRDAAQRARAQAERGENPEAEETRLLQRGEGLDEEENQAEAEFAEIGKHLEEHQLPDEIKQRHAQALADYRARMKELKQRFKDFKQAHDRGDPTHRQRRLGELADFLNQSQKVRKHQPFDPNQLPFSTPDDQVRPPKERKEELEEIVRPPQAVKVAANELLPGLLAANDPGAAPTADDLAENEDVQLTQAIRDQAAALRHSPVEIYNWVRNNIEFLPTYGSIQGSDLTLQTRRGNAFDTASLLIALLRASNIPARYAYGTVQIPAEQVMNWVGGVKTPEAAQSLLGQGGIPTVGMLSGGKISAFKLEHVWVEAFVDYIPSRGAVHKAGDTWVPMDAAFKQYDYSLPLNVAEIAGFDIPGDITHVLQNAILDEANSSVTGLDETFLSSKLESYQAKLAAYAQTQGSPLTLDQAFGGKTIHKTNYPMLFGTLPYTTITSSTRTSSLPDTMRHTLSMEFFTTDIGRSLGSPSLTQTISLPRLRGQRLGITYVPATAADASVLQSLDASNADTIPLYLVRVKPQIKLDDAILMEGSTIGMGADQYLDIVVSGPKGQKRLSYARIAGDEMVVGVDGSGIGFEQITKRFQTTPSDTAAENLHQLSLHYWAESDLFNRLNQPTYGVNAVRLPSTGIFSSPLSVIYSFGMPRIGYYLKRNIDIRLSLHAVAGPDREKIKGYVGHTGVIGSYLESSIQEQLFNNWQGTGLSTMQVFLDANQQHIPMYSLNSSNYGQLLSRLQIPADAMSDIQTALAAGLELVVPERVPTKTVGVSGIGYQIRDPQTGSASYRIWGGTNGGDGETPCAERQRRPLTQVVRDVVLTVVVLEILVLAGWYLPGLIGGLAGAGVAAGLRPVLAQIMASVGLEALTFPATAGNDICEPLPSSFGRNKDAIHDQCADLAPPNEYQGNDVCVAGVNFDAISNGKRILWEVKTENYSNAKKDFIRESTVNGWLAQVAKHVAIAKVKCAHRGFGYNFLVGDARYVPLFTTKLASSSAKPDEIVGGPSYCTSLDQ